MDGEPKGPAVQMRMYNSGNTSFDWNQSMFNNISEALTVNSRMLGDGSYSEAGTRLTPDQINTVFARNQNIDGTALTNSVCLHVRWGWLTYPASLILLTGIYLLSTILDKRPEAKDLTSKTNTFTAAGVWKSSVPPLMFHGLDDEHLRQIEPFRLTPLHELERTAKRTKTRLIATYNGWKFFKTD